MAAQILLIERDLNPLSANSDQHQFSPTNPHTLPRGKVMRINKDYERENA